jgi:argininosuccinate lyase
VAAKAWGGRFAEATDSRVEQFTESISFDRRLFRQDIAGSIAHARMLAKVGVLTDDEAGQIEAGLKEIEQEIADGKMAFSVELEDIHMHVERALVERLGDVGRKLHTARSRNDQVATDLKLWVREAIDRLDGLLAEVQRAFVGRAEVDMDVVLPGYTHLQRAQPVLAAHYCLAYVEKLARDRERLADCRKRVNILPLGAGALAGTSFPIDRQFVAAELGFDAVAANSMDVSGDRDFCLETVFVATVVALHLSGWAEEWVLWSSQEFGFVELPDAFTTGSSIMPQKKNPDILELVRGKTARVHGDLTALVTLVKGLPMAYNRDLQEDKERLFDALDTVEACAAMAAAVVRASRWSRERIAERLEDGFLDATSLAEHLVRRGTPFRTAHEQVGRLVRVCVDRGCRLADLSAEDFGEAGCDVGADVHACLGVQGALAVFRSEGSTAPAEVRKQLDHWRGRLGM